jgi:RNA polymerase sigma factor (TIGR02999 family)
LILQRRGPETLWRFAVDGMLDRRASAANPLLTIEGHAPPDHSAEQGEDAAKPKQLFVLLYDELHRLARRELKNGGATLVLGPTTLLHEMYIAMQGRQGLEFPDRARFFAYASRAMRGLIIDYSRRRQTLRRGGAFEITSFPTDVPDHIVDSVELQRLNDAIDRLAQTQPRLAEVVDLKYFSGFALTDIAAMWGVSTRTVKRDWEKARVFLRQALTVLNE